MLVNRFLAEANEGDSYDLRGCGLFSHWLFRVAPDGDESRGRADQANGNTGVGVGFNKISKSS